MDALRPLLKSLDNLHTIYRIYYGIFMSFVKIANFRRRFSSA